ncbi:MAG TPA: outer membrane beta-barrel protein [Pyrinomonadaceae bacterium]|nr:outer membrane beta-barrel protein [Pyrinomonadaceae bacterium]
MKKLMLLAILVACSAPSAFAQTTDYDKVNVFVGYSHNRVDTGVEDNDPDVGDIIEEREGFNGINASVTGNVSRYVGLKFDYSFHTRNIEFGPDNTSFRLQNFLGGVQIKDNTKDETKTVKPFAHFLVGAARASVDLTEFDNTLEDFNDTGLAFGIGGGLDVRVNDRIDIRAIQFDYNPNRFSPPSGLTNQQAETLHNFRIGIGVVFK